MSIEEGHFRLYTHVEPALKAGDYRFTTTQSLNATGKNGALAPAQLPVQPLATNVRVTSPRYQLPPDQVLSTYPPAGTEGSYGSRLPQVVIKRRTLPWERAVTGADDATPWLALVVFAEGEAEVVSNAPVDQCVSAGRHLSGPKDVEKGSCLQISTSMAAKILPTRKDVPLLAHAREVNINDTELMMGDDDGFLAVVVANRLPLSGRDPQGKETPVKYHACLINLEEQFDLLIPEAPPHSHVTDHWVLDSAVKLYSAAEYDHFAMNVSQPLALDLQANIASPGNKDVHLGQTTAFYSGVSTDSVTSAYSGSGSWSQTIKGEVVEATTSGSVGVGFYAGLIAATFDPPLRFPVLLHWTFTSIGDETFEYYMRNVDSGLLGTTGADPVPPPGRPPLEVVETGHIGIDQRTRRGDLVRAWYRGPLLPHPADMTSPRLPLAHTGDQLRAVIPDGREDVSLAAAFEIGRLLALSQPSMVNALLRWRQLGYQAARSSALWSEFLRDFAASGFELEVGRTLGPAMGRGVAQLLTAQPGDTIGPPRELHTAGTPMGIDGNALQLMSHGFGVSIAGDTRLDAVLQTLQTAEVPLVPLSTLTAAANARVLSGVLAEARDTSLVGLVSGALSTHIVATPDVAGPGVTIPDVAGPGVTIPEVTHPGVVVPDGAVGIPFVSPGSLTGILGGVPIRISRDAEDES